MSNGSITPDAAPSTMSNRALGKGNKTKASLIRSASYAELPSDTTSKTIPQRANSLSRSFSENVLVNMQGNVSRKPSTKQELDDTPKKRRSLRRLGSMRRKSIVKETAAQHTISEFTLGADGASEDSAYEPPTRKVGQTPERDHKTRSVSGSVKSFARKSWISASRSPSPSPSRNRSRKETAVEFLPKPSPPKSAIGEKVPHTVPNGHENGPANGVTRKQTMLNKRSRRPLSSLLSKNSVPDTPSVPPIPKSFSTDKLPSLKHKSSTLSNAPAVPKTNSFDRLQGIGVETPRKKDALWSAFRILDGEYQKFQSRPSTLKTAVVRSALLPFLRNHSETLSVTSLRPEDLDRRTVILNKWWTALLEMLNGRHGESVSGNDRPAILEAVTALMIRAEWTLPALTTAVRSGKTPRASLTSRSTTSLGSTMTMSSDFLADSVYHNVKNTFTQNLLAQMAYVVDKMSTRSVPASVVTFCGKATAYAFFYCEGVADILVRLWAIPPDTMRRILAESGIRKEAQLDPILSDRICAAFPPCLHSLKFRSLRLMVSYLRGQPHVPFATAYISWRGPWVGRWAGRDTDLFFVFTKFYTDLVCRFLPEEPSPEEMMAAPGWLLVQAQILTALDAIMQRTNSQSYVDQSSGPSSITFDDMLGDPDATATVLPLSAQAAARSMAENRLVMAVRDCLLGSTVISSRAQSLYAKSFGSVLKAAAQKTSIFDHNACFTLCDFLEEAFVILTRYDQTPANPAIDWPFWLSVYKKMLESQNSMTEVRLCSFLFSMWGTITGDQHRKREVCLDWILEKETFQTQFCHWCPMVRAFFMRLLVWRVARFDGSSPDLDVTILKILAERLHETWRHLLHLQEHAETNASVAPSTAACSPAPGRRLFIVRNDVQPASSGAFLSFEGILSSVATAKANPYERHSTRDPFAQAGTTQSANGSGAGKKRWNLFSSMIPTSYSAKDRPQLSPTKERSWPASVNGANSPPRRNGSIAGPRITRPQRGQGDTRSSADHTSGPTPSHQSLSFKFSLEWIDRDTSPVGRERRLQPPTLPLPAQLALQSRQGEVRDNTPLKPEGAATGPSKYAGRALAEWAMLIVECQNFFERRRAEGVPTYQMVETPTLGVDPFRKL